MFLFANAEQEPSQRRGSGRARSSSPEGTRSNSWFDAQLMSLRGQSHGDRQEAERSNSTNSIRQDSASALTAPPGRMTRANSSFFRRPINSGSLLEGGVPTGNSRKSFRGFAISRDSGDDSGSAMPVWGGFARQRASSMRQRACSTRFDLSGVPSGALGPDGLPRDSRDASRFDKGLVMRRASTMQNLFKSESSSLLHANGRHEPTGKAASLHAEPSGEVVVINRRANSRLSQLIPRLLRLHPMGVIFAGAMLYTCVAVAFAAIFYGFGEACFAFSEVSFTYVEVLWLSVHTLTTVGFGSAVPICAGPQVMVLLESYLGLLVQAMIGAYVVFVFMRSRARVRFSRHCLVTRVRAAELEAAARLANGGHGEGGAELVYEVRFRMVRESFTEVRDARIYVQARYSVPSGEPEADGTFSKQKVVGEASGGKDDDDELNDPTEDIARGSPSNSPNKALNRALGKRRSGSGGSGGSGSPSRDSTRRDSSASQQSAASIASAVELKGALEQRAELGLQTEQMSSLDYWEVVHRIDVNSPLHPIKNLLETHLKSIDVSITAYDPAFNQPVKLYARYASHEIRHNYRFESMDSTNEGTSVITVDHSKLDLVKKQSETPARTKQRRGSADLLSTAHSLVGSLTSLRSRMRRGSEDDLAHALGGSEAGASDAGSSAAEGGKRKSRTSITSGFANLKRSMSLDMNESGCRNSSRGPRRPSDEDSPSAGTSDDESVKKPAPPPKRSAMKQGSKDRGDSSDRDGKRNSLPTLHLRFGSRRGRSPKPSKENMLEGGSGSSREGSAREGSARDGPQSRSSPLVPEGMRRESSNKQRKTSFTDENNVGPLAVLASGGSAESGQRSSGQPSNAETPSSSRKQQNEEVPQELEA